MADVDATPLLKKHNGCAGAKRGAYRLKAPANQGLLQIQSCEVQILTRFNVNRRINYAGKCNQRNMLDT